VEFAVTLTPKTLAAMRWLGYRRRQFGHSKDGRSLARLWGAAVSVLAEKSSRPN